MKSIVLITLELHFYDYLHVDGKVCMNHLTKIEVEFILYDFG